VTTENATTAPPPNAASPSPAVDRILLWLPRIAGWALIAAIGLALTTAVVDTDFWWHLASGRWMAEHRQLLDHDPFGPGLDFGEGTARRDFVLRQFWFAQLLFRWVWELAGPTGIILFRALVLGALFALVWRRLRALGAPAPLAALLVGATAQVMIVEIAYVADRPQLFTSLGLVVLLELLDRAFEGKRWALWSLPALFVLWANLHAGFVVGAGVAGLYALTQLRSLRSSPRPFVFVGAAVLASGLNPCGYEAAWQAFGTSASSASPYWRQIVEWQSIFDHSTIAGIGRRLPALFWLGITAIVGLVLHLLKPRALRFERLALALLATALGVRAIRFIPFFAVVAAEMAALGLGPWATRLAAPLLERVRRAVPVLSAAGVLAVAAWFAVLGFQTTALGAEKPYNSSLEPPVKVIRDGGLRGVLFNDHNDGGFLDHALPPDVKVFIDGRALSIRAFDLSRLAVDSPEAPAPFAAGVPAYKAILELAGADMVLLPGADPISGTLIRLSEVLLRDPDWAVVFADGRSILFVRRTGPLGRFARARQIPAAAGYENMLAIAARVAGGGGHGHGMAAWKLTAAVALTRTGRASAAMPLLTDYARSNPGDPLVFRLQAELAGAGAR
jgi:hypothetical protein